MYRQCNARPRTRMAQHQQLSIIHTNSSVLYKQSLLCQHECALQYMQPDQSGSCTAKQPRAEEGLHSSLHLRRHRMRHALLQHDLQALGVAACRVPFPRCSQRRLQARCLSSQPSHVSNPLLQVPLH